MKSLLRTGMVPLLVGALLSACTYGIVLDAGGQGVNTDWTGQRLANCRDIGKVTVSVMSRVGPVDRNDIKVRDELQVMARNEAATMHADTIKPLAEPADGSQPWGAYQCGANRVPPPARSSAPASSAPGNAQTFPIQGH